MKRQAIGVRIESEWRWKAACYDLVTKSGGGIHAFGGTTVPAIQVTRQMPVQSRLSCQLYRLYCTVTLQISESTSPHIWPEGGFR